MTKIQDMKNSQYFKHKSYPGEYFKVWMNPFQVFGKWTVEATCAGDYAYDFDEDDEENIEIVSWREVFKKKIS